MPRSSDAFHAARITVFGSFHLDLTSDDAFNLFTAAGERLWVPGWSPRILGSLPQAPGLVFLTGDDADSTIWTVVTSDRVSSLVCYSRVTPGSQAGIVTVTMNKAAEGCQVTVSYDMTALSSRGAANLHQYSPDRFTTMLGEWQRLITAFLRKDDARHLLAKILV